MNAVEQTHMRISRCLEFLINLRDEIDNYIETDRENESTKPCEKIQDYFAVWQRISEYQMKSNE